MSNFISDKKIPPSGPEDSDILIIGEAPGYEEDVTGIPFVGDAGQLLDQVLSLVGLDRSNIRVTNVSCYRPTNNKFDYLLNSWQLKEGIDEVKAYIQSHKDKLKFVIICGAKPLEFILKRTSIEKWRSSVIEQDGVKYFCSYHPSAIIRDRTLYGTFTFDFRKFYRYYKQGYTRPTYNLTLDPKGLELEEALREIEQHKLVTSDIECVRQTTKILCCGFGLSPNRAIVLGNNTFGDMDYTFYTACKRILENPDIIKVFQNGFGYDIEVLRENGINVAGYKYDTMIAAHVLDPELPYGLDFLCTLYTDQPYYKDRGKTAIPDDESKGWNSDKIDTLTLYEYNGLDCTVDYKVWECQAKELTEGNLWDVYYYKFSLIPLGQELSRSGMEIDVERRELLRVAVKLKWKYYQEILNAIAGFNVNVKSLIDMKKLLLEDFNLPERRKDGNITFDEDAIVSYLAFIKDKINVSVREATIEQWSMRLAACKCILLIRGFRQLLSNYINIKYSSDGRIRSVYNLAAATETGRGSSHKWVDGTGNNAQTWPRERLEITDNEIKILRERGFNI